MSRLNRIKRKKKDTSNDSNMQNVVKSLQYKYMHMAIIALVEMIILQDWLNIWVRAIIQALIVTLLIVNYVRAKRR